ncbi:MAG TPA: LLM class flavin-dependent oxidoreductase, partial [Sphingomonadaceae bacterium]|nr:LLM class flavin-dependent oxidoreductase [Sphingomonadaceae bacterium]
DGLPAEHPFAPLRATLPGGRAGSPDIWLLGSSMDSALWAAEAGLPYCFADFINSDGAEMAEQYRRRFKPSARLAAPYVMAAVWTIAAPASEEARRLAAPAAMMFAHLVRGQLIAVPPVETALAWQATNPAPGRRRRTVLGTPAEARAQLDAVAAEYGASELMLVNILPDHAARVASYRLIAAEYGLAEREPAA